MCTKPYSPSTMQANKQVKYDLLDCLRLLCAFLVVLLHATEFRDSHSFSHMMVVCFSSQAVPFFFIVSGFFLASKLKGSANPKAVLLNYARKQLILYFAWALTELPSIIVYYRRMHSSRSLVYTLLLTARRMFLAGVGAYWYILSLSIAALFVGYYYIKHRKTFLYIIAVICLFWGYSYDADLKIPLLFQLNQMMYVVFSWSNNFMMKAIPYVTIGFLIHEYKDQLHFRLTPLILSYLLLGAVSITLFMQLPIDKLSHTKYFFFYPIQAVLLILIGLSYGKPLPNHRVYIIVRELSVSIYFLHSLIIYKLIDPIFSVYSPVGFKFISSLILSTLIFIVAKKLKWKPLCWLLSIKTAKESQTSVGHL